MGGEAAWTPSKIRPLRSRGTIGKTANSGRQTEVCHTREGQTEVCVTGVCRPFRSAHVGRRRGECPGGGPCPRPQKTMVCPTGRTGAVFFIAFYVQDASRSG